MKTKVYLVEDHALVRETLREYIGRTPDFAVSGAAASAEEALTNHAAEEADLVLSDVKLPGMSGIELVRVLHERRPSLRCLLLSAYGGAYYAREALEAGARGYVEKVSGAELIAALRQVSRGETYVCER